MRLFSGKACSLALRRLEHLCGSGRDGFACAGTDLDHRGDENRVDPFSFLLLLPAFSSR